MLLAPYFPSLAPGNLARPSLHGLPSKTRAAQLPALLGRAPWAATSGNSASHNAPIMTQVCVMHSAFVVQQLLPKVTTSPSSVAASADFALQQAVNHL